MWFGVWTFTEFLCLTNAFAFIVASLPRDFLLSSDRPRHLLLMVGQSLSVCDCWRCPVKGFSDCCDCWFLSSLHFTSDELESRVGKTTSVLPRRVLFIRAETAINDEGSIELYYLSYCLRILKIYLPLSVGFGQLNFIINLVL